SQNYLSLCHGTKLLVSFVAVKRLVMLFLRVYLKIRSQSKEDIGDKKKPYYVPDHHEQLI
ncbi:6842_t:CDS:1, partial [Funneliformis mosseae]